MRSSLSWLVYLDLDGTVLSGDAAREARFREWASRRARSVALAYSSGRSVQNIRSEIRSGRLPVPDFIVAQLGTAIELPDGDAPGFAQALFGGVHASWSLAEAMRAGIGPGVEPQEAEHLNPYKASFYWDGIPASLAAFEDRVGMRFPSGSFRIMAVDGRYIDLMPHCVGKAAAAKAIARAIGVPPDSIVAAGDSENDQDLFLEPAFKRILPANAAAFLRVLAPGAYESPYPDADGVLDGLARLGLA